MRFIKDIIGEKREKAHNGSLAGAETAGILSGLDTPETPPASRTGSEPEAAAPLVLDSGFLTGSEPPAPMQTAAAEDIDDGEAETGDPDPFAVLDEPGAGRAGTGIPDEQAIAAFFAREREQSGGALTEVSQDAAVEDEPADEDLPGPGRLDRSASGADEPEDALPAAGEPHADRGGGKQYKIFTRSRITAAPEGSETVPETGEPFEGAEQVPEAASIRDSLIAAASADDGVAEDLDARVQDPWETEDFGTTAASLEAADPMPIDVPEPAMGRGASRAGRVKTRLLGFNPADAAAEDPFSRSAESTPQEFTQFPVGWLAVVQGPGRGAAFTLYNGVTVMGRGEGQTVRLDFGDNSISRDNHAAIAYDPEQQAFYIGHGGKANLVRRNNRPVLSTEELAAGDLIRIGETTLRFVPLCGPDFGWDQAQQGDGGHAAAV